jgi:hypothetical protein
MATLIVTGELGDEKGRGDKEARKAGSQEFFCFWILVRIERLLSNQSLREEV